MSVSLVISLIVMLVYYKVSSLWLYLIIILVVCGVHSQTNTQSHYNVIQDHNITSFVGGNYGNLHTVSLGDEEVIHLPLPFEFQFFERRFKNAYLSSNGLLSFENAPVNTGASTTVKAKSTRDMSDRKVVVLHRDVKALHMSQLLQHINVRHNSDEPEHVHFSAKVSQTFHGLKMFSVSHMSPTAQQFLESHEHVLHVHDNLRLSLDESLVNEDAPATEKLHPFSGARKSTYTWGLDRIDQTNLPLDLNEYDPPLRSYGGRASSVYVLDTGIDSTHNEFRNREGSQREVKNVFNYFGEIMDNQDGNGHGTHCAGIKLLTAVNKSQ